MRIGIVMPLIAQFHCLVDAADREVVRAERLEFLGDLHRAVSVGVGLHDAEELDGRTDVLPDAAVVVRQIVEVDFRPGSSQR